MKILLLEDDFMLCDIVKDYLTSNRFNVVTAENGNEAKDLIYSENFDLLIFDINVPQLNGLNVANIVRKNGFKTPLIFISSSIEKDDFKIASKYCGNNFLRKPFTLEELLVKINKLKKNILLKL